MFIKTDYLKKGFSFIIARGDKPVRFPLDRLDRKLIQDEDWNTLNLLEQIWYQGLLSYDSGRYLLSAEDFYELDTDTTALLPIPHRFAKIGLTETGNVGRSDHRIVWYVFVRGKNAGRCQRMGCVVRAGGYDFLLNQAQYRLLTEIEKGSVASSSEERARFQARIKYLARKAGAVLSPFMESRDFLFSESAEISLVAEQDQEIRFQPLLSDVPDDLQTLLPRQLKGVVQFNAAGRRTRVFSPPEVQEQYNQIGAIPPVRGKDVPRFLENPLSFLPEKLVFDANQFSARVRGLKIRTARAVPYIHIEPDEENSGWFDLNTGITVHETSGETPDLNVEQDPELERQINDAIEAGESYLYYDHQWIKLSPDACKRVQELKAQEESVQHLTQKQAERILDIYDNIDGIEYNEASLQLKQLALRWMEQSGLAKSFCGQLKDYQLEGYRFLQSHYETKSGVLLADDMGLGKTVQVIALFASLWDRGELAPALLVMPTALIENWISEMAKFLPSARALYVHQGAARYRSGEMIRNHDVVLTTYETLARDQALLGTIRWSCVVCDEVQKIKNFHTLAANAVKGMNTGCRIALTGTPVENRLSELWSIADFAQPGLLNSYQYFRNHYEKPIQSGGADRQEVSEELIQALSPIFLRRTKEAVLGEALPLKSERSIALPLSPAQEQLYLQLVEEVKSSKENIALATIQKLIMLCSHPRLVSKKNGEMKASVLEAEAPKLAWTVEQLREIRRAKEKVVIFTGYIC